MRLASWRWGGHHHIGIISADGRDATPLGLAEAGEGVLPINDVIIQ